jgi:CarD family transcriptional regulator
MLNIGDVVVYGSRGLCEIKDILVPEFAAKGSEKLYYMLSSSENKNGMLYVAVEGSDEKFHSAMSDEQARGLVDSIETMDELDFPDGKRGEPYITAVINKNQAREMMGLVKTLYMAKVSRIKAGKTVTSMTDRYLNTAERLLFTELAYSTGYGFDDVRQRVYTSLEKASGEYGD